MSQQNIDIVLTHHNGSRHIEAQINSIIRNDIRQGFSVRIIVVDDGSQNDEFRFVQEICRQYPNIQLHRNETNLGVIKAFETGLQLSTADYVMLSDQDDLWLPDKIQSSLDHIQLIEGDKAALVFTDLCVVNEHLECLRSSMLELKEFNQASDKYRILFQNIVAGCTSIVNRKLLDIALPFPVDIPMHDHWLAACAAFGGKIDLLNRPTVLYRQHENNLVGSRNWRLVSRLLQPRKSLAQLHDSLKIKSVLANRLADRLESKTLKFEMNKIRKIADAFRVRSIKHLTFLISAQVFQTDPIRMGLTSLAYMIPSMNIEKSRKIG